MSTVIDSLVSAINNAVKANGNKEITGNILQVVLDNMVGTLTQINGLLNVNQVNSKSTAYASASDARQAVPDNLKTEGLVIAYKLSSGWIIEQNKDISGTWTADASWQTIFHLTNPDLLTGLNVVAGSYHHYISNDGTIQQYDNQYILGYYGYVRVNPSTEYLIKKQRYGYDVILAFYDWDGNYISSLEDTTTATDADIEFTTPSNCYWVRVNKFDDSSPNLRYKNNPNVVPSGNALQGNPYKEPTIPDLLTGLNVVDGSYHHYIGANGEIQEYDNPSILGYYGYVRVNPGTEYLIKKQSIYAAILAYYDWNGKYIALLNDETTSIDADIEFTTPSNCYWVRINKFADSSPNLRYKHNTNFIPSGNAFIGAPDTPLYPTKNLDFSTRNVDTFVGAMNYVLTKLFTQRPLARVVFVTHFSRDWASKGDLSNLVKAQLGLAKYWQASIINVCDNLNWVRRDGLDILGSHISDHLHPAQDYNTTTQKSANIEEIAKICADELLKIYPANEWSGKKVAWFGTSIPDGYPYTPQGEGRTTWEVNARYPNVAVGQLLGATIFNYAKGGALVRQKKYDGSSFPAGDDYRDQFSNDDTTYNANNTGVYEHDYEYGRITYKTYIIDKLGTADEPDLYVFDFGFNDFYIDNADFADLNYDSIP